ncbi:MAG TPA: type I-D CRISPR-associated helicase Cas3' [Chloroflexi bacterium]|nr:type I-D CRISPR-associated helicase Cas3' [Chloroflexota bacterium]
MTVEGEPLELEIAPLAYEQVEADWLPSYTPYAYQWEVYLRVAEAFEKHEALCLFLVTPTGSGKTLASYAYSIKNGIPALGVYPTNELIRDQERALAKEYEQVQGWRDWVLRVDSRTLDEWGLDLEEPAHAETLEILLNWRRVVLTNPDILYYIAFGRYPKREDRPGQRERLFKLLGSIYRLWVFDEFHLYNVKQMGDVAFLIGALKAISPDAGRVFIFASATPELEIVPLLQDKLGLKVEIIQAEPVPLETGRIIAHPVHLTVIPTDLERWQGVETLLEQAGLLDEFLARYPEARLVTILDSVAGAIRLAEAWRERYPDKAIGEVHGFSSEKQRREALRRPITVGTSTIEVGIDFKDEAEKDVLIFEARTAGQFIQRFGRLARHARKTDIPNWAVALVPEYVYHSLKQSAVQSPEPTVGSPQSAVQSQELRTQDLGLRTQDLGLRTQDLRLWTQDFGLRTQDLRLRTQDLIPRQTLYSWVEDAYRAPENFQNYIHLHAPAEYTEAVNFIRNLFQRDDRGRIVPGMEECVKQLCGCSPKQAYARWRRYHEEEIIWPLLTFRGSGLQVAILDERGVDPGFPVRRYDLMFVLRQCDFEEMTQEEFLAELERLAGENPAWRKEAERELRFAKPIGREPRDLLGVYGFFRLKGMLDKGRRVWFELGEDEVWGRKEQVTVIQGLELCTDPPVRVRLLSKRLRRKKLAAWFTDRHPKALRLGRALPPLFEVYELKVRRMGGAESPGSWCIAFNQNAFFLDCLHPRGKRPKDWRRAKEEVVLL